MYWRRQFRLAIELEVVQQLFESYKPSLYEYHSSLSKQNLMCVTAPSNSISLSRLLAATASSGKLTWFLSIHLAMSFLRGSDG